MFYGCFSITSVGLSNINKANFIDMRFMLYEYISLKSIDLSNINNANVVG